MEERGASILADKKRLDQFEVAHGDLVEFERSRVLLEFEAVDVQGIDFLRGADVVENCAGGDGGGGMPVEAEAFESAHVELAFDQRHGEIAGPDPVFDPGAGGNAFERRGQARHSKAGEPRWARL